jgi:hypothetical protein
MKSIIFFAAAAAAHFGLNYPEWRADTLNEDDKTLNQRIYPCKFSFTLQMARGRPMAL